MRRLLVVLIAVAACGDDSNRHIIDAPQQPGDGPDIDAALPAVTLTITRNGAPQPNINVFFQNADSHLVALKQTDTSGVASTVMAAGGFVTAIDPFALPLFVLGKGPHDDLYTFAGVKPGDQLVLDQPAIQTIAVTVNVPTSANPLTAQYTVTSSCMADPIYDIGRTAASGSGTQPSFIVYLPNCTGPSDVMVTAETTDGRPLLYLYLHDQTFTDAQTVDWTAMTYTDAITRDHSYTNVPAAASNFNIVDIVESSHGLVYAGYGGVTYGGTTTTEQLTLPTYTNASDLVLADVQTDTNTLHHLLDWGAQAGPFTTDVAARALTGFTSYPQQSTTALDAITWDEGAAGVAPDFALGEVTIQRSVDAKFWNWSYAGPHTAGTFVLPTLPPAAGIYDFNPNSSDTVSFDLLLMGKVPGGYDAVRAHLFALRAGPSYLVVGATGTATIEEPTLPLATARVSRPTLWRHAAANKPVLLRHRRG